METKKEKQGKMIDTVITIAILTNNDGSVYRCVLIDSKGIYTEKFANQSAWIRGGGNPVLDLMEKRFLFTPEKREDISQYRCDISNGSKGVRRVLSELLHLQMKLLNRLFKRGFFCDKTANPYEVLGFEIKVDVRFTLRYHFGFTAC